MLPPESALMFRAASMLVPRPMREDWRREWEAELWWWLSSTPDPARLPLARHCWGALSDAFCLRMMERPRAGFPLRACFETPLARLALPVLLLAVLAAFSGGFRQTRRALGGTASDRLVILTETGPFMGQMMALPQKKLTEWNARSQTLASLSFASRTRAICTLRPGIRPAEAETELRAWNGFMHLTPMGVEIARPAMVLGPTFLALMLLALAYWIRSGSTRAFHLAHPLAWLTLLFLAAIEAPASPAALWLPYLITSFLALRYSWSDARRRCPDCLERLALPVRIGLGPRSPFEPSGTEFLCPNGHGALFITREADPESHWTSLVA